MGFQEMKLACVLALALCAVAVVQADELKDLSSVDVAAPVEAASLEKTDKAVEPAPKSGLGESTGNMFSGALLTSGSFTMMASAGYEEEEELGEGEHRKHVLWCAAHIRFFHDDGKCRVLSHHVSSTSGQQGGPWCGGAWFASAQGLRVGSARGTHGTAAPQRRRPCVRNPR